MAFGLVPSSVLLFRGIAVLLELDGFLAAMIVK